jgi:hypothetical protein
MFWEKTYNLLEMPLPLFLDTLLNYVSMRRDTLQGND